MTIPLLIACIVFTGLCAVFARIVRSEWRTNADHGRHNENRANVLCCIAFAAFVVCFFCLGQWHATAARVVLETTAP